MLEEPEDKNRNELVQNLEQTNPNSTSIGKNSSSMQSEDVITLTSGKKHYLCNKCKSFHLIKIDERKIIIDCNKNEKIKLGQFLLNNILNIENLEVFKLCLIHKSEKIGFCPKCKKDLCSKCKEVKDCENNKSHNFLDFKTKNDEISKKEKFILSALKKKDKRPKIENSSNPGTLNISEKAKFIKVDEKEIKILEKKSVTECLEELSDIPLFMKTLMNSKENIPSYMHYENINILYH